MPYRKLLIIFVVVMGVLLTLSWFSVVGRALAAKNYQTGSDLSIQKTALNAPFVIGQIGRYQISVDNIGTADYTGVITVTDNVPASLTVTGASGAGWNCSFSVQPVSCRHTGGLTTGDPPLIIAISATVGLAAAPSVSNTAALSGVVDDSASNNDSTVATQVVGADLAVTKSVTPLTRGVNEPVTYSIRLTNHGPSDTTGVVLTDTFPVDVTLVTPVPPGYDQNTRRWTVGNLAANQTVTLTLQASVNVSARGKTVTNTTEGVSSALYDYNSTNNTGSASFQVKPDLTVSMTDGRTTVTPGLEYSYVVRVTNIGTIVAPDFVITDTLSQYLTIISDTLPVNYTKSGDIYSWRLTDDIPFGNGEAGPYTITVKVDSSLPGASTSIINTVKVATSLSELNPNNNTATDTNTASGSHNVSLTLSVSPTSVRTGQNATYTIRVTNSGTAAVTDVIVSDTFSQYVDISSASTSKGSRTTDSSARRVTANVGTLDANQSATITVVTTVNSTARSNLTVSNVASASYRFGGSTFTKTSSSASFSLVFSTTLPGTGGIELRAKDAPPGVTTVATLCAILLVGIGILSFVYGLRMRSRQSDWGGWALRMGLLFTFAGLLFGFAAWGFSKIPSTQPPATSVAMLNSSAKTMATPHLPEDLPWEGMVLNAEPDPLPDFPIPEPTHVPQDDNGQTADTSPVNRIVLPSLGVDTIVKYVPFDGFTWLIAGLQQEVAWMGDTSWPGLGSNTGFAGHVTLWNGRDGPFRNLDQLQTNDPVTIFTEENQYTYQVREKVVVSDIEMSVIQPTSGSHITLITCTNWDAAASVYLDRLVISADLVSVTPIQESVQGN